MILTTPAIAALRQNLPAAHITLVVTSDCAELLPAIPGADRALIMRRNLRDLAAYFAIAREKFDCCIDFTQNDRSGLLTFLSRATKRIASLRVKSHSQRRARIYNAFEDVRLIDMHTVDYNLGLLAPLGITNTSQTLHLALPASAENRAGQLLREAKIDPSPPASRAAGNSFVIFHPGSARQEKFWEPERWAEVIEHTRRERGLDAVITGGTWALEQQHIRAIKAMLTDNIDSAAPESSPARLGHPYRSSRVGSIVDLSRRTDLLALAALIAKARLLVTVDSAAMHLAAALGTPQVALFGPTNPFHWRPRGSRALILHGESRAPISEFSAKQERLPMKHISTQAVFDAMDSLLSAPAAQHS